MKEWIPEFFGWTSGREPEGWFSWQHLTYVTLMIFLTVAVALLLGKKYRNREFEDKRHVLRVASCLMIGFELIKIVNVCLRNHNFWEFRSVLPLFLCSILLFSLPIAAFGKGRLRDAALDFSFCFGGLCCVAGTYLAGNIFSGSPVLSFDPMVSVTTHCISGFATVYIGSAGLVSMKKRNLPLTVLILLLFEAAALTADLLQLESPYESNYMFFMNDAGTPFSICMNIVGGNQVLYTIFVAFLYFIYLGLFIGAYLLVRKAKNARFVENHE